MHITLNQQPQPVPPGWEDEPLLWLLREPLGLTGTRFGCGMGQCGACTIHIDGLPARSCITPIGSVPLFMMRNRASLAAPAAPPRRLPFSFAKRHVYQCLAQSCAYRCVDQEGGHRSLSGLFHGNSMVLLQPYLAVML